MRYSIKDKQNQTVEDHTSPWYAERALRILQAHEFKNGRTPEYRIVPTIEPIPIDQLKLPDWALEALEGK
jgi:hypothetical protein